MVASKGKNNTRKVTDRMSKIFQEVKKAALLRDNFKGKFVYRKYL